MTTAARPTFEPARGGKTEKSLAVLSKAYSSRDLPSHLKLKYRQQGQNSSDDLKNKDFKRELHHREKLAQFEKESRKRFSDSSLNRTYNDLPSSKKLAIESIPVNLDADDKIIDIHDDNIDDDEDADDSDDDTADLLAELNKIKKERAAREAQREMEKNQQEEKIRMENILRGNPLLSSNSTDFKVKRRWDDDVVFKNCARNDPDVKNKPFINDTLRSEFHKKFMEKYIK